MSLQGHGVQKDIPKALTFLKKAMEKVFYDSLIIINTNYCIISFFGGFHSIYWLFHYFIPQDFVPAINALAWYYEKFNQDYEQAVKLWEQADELGSPDAALNLAVMHSQGLYPGKAADQVSSSMLFVIV